MNTIEQYYFSLLKVIENVWHDEHRLSDILIQCCFMFVATEAWYFFTLFLSLFERTVTYSDKFLWQYNYLVGWSNVCINILFLLVVAEVSQSIIVGYTRYKSEYL